MMTTHSSQFFSALADPSRMKITELLASNGTMSAGDISAKFDISPPAISQHLKILREAEVIAMEKQAQKRLYKINPTSFDEVETWILQLKKTMDRRFDQLDELLKQ